jgi:hypothetical protein
MYRHAVSNILVLRLYESFITFPLAAARKIMNKFLKNKNIKMQCNVFSFPVSNPKF